MFGGIIWQKHLRFNIILVLMMMRKLVMSNYGKTNFILMVATRAPYGSGRVGSTALPDPKYRVGSGNGSKRVRMGQTGLKFDKSVILEYLDEYRSNRNDFTVIGFVLMRRIQ